MGTALIVIMSILVYAFCARVVYRNGEKLFNLDYSKEVMYYEDLSDKEVGILWSSLFPIAFICILVAKVFTYVFKLADFATNPDNYKFSIEIKRKES